MNLRLSQLTSIIWTDGQYIRERHLVDIKLHFRSGLISTNMRLGTKEPFEARVCWLKGVSSHGICSSGSSSAHLQEKCWHTLALQAAATPSISQKPAAVVLRRINKGKVGESPDGTIALSFGRPQRRSCKKRVIDRGILHQKALSLAVMAL